MASKECWKFPSFTFLNTNDKFNITTVIRKVAPGVKLNENLVR